MNNQIQEFKEILSYHDTKRELIKKHLYLNIFLYDEDYIIRYRVAKQGYYHDICQYDEDWGVRYGVALYTKDKNILLHLSNDKDRRVREDAKYRINKLYNE